MKLQNRQTKEIVEATKNEDGSYEVEGKTVKAEDMSRLYMKPKEEAPKEDVGGLVVESYSTQSDELNELGKALALCQGEFEAVKKTSSTKMYDYADLEAVLASSRTITSKHGLSIIQLNMTKAIGDNLLAGVKTMLLHESGQWIASEAFVPVQKTKMNSLVQNMGGILTYTRRYGLQSILGLATVDNDGANT